MHLKNRELFILFILTISLTTCSYADNVLRNITLRNIYIPSMTSGSSSTFDMTNSSNYVDIIYSTPKTGYLESNAFSRGLFSTTSTSMVVVGYSNLYGIAGGAFNGYADIGVRVNNADYQALNFTTSGAQTFTVSLPAGVKNVEVVSGLQSSNNSPGSVYGSWPKTITFQYDPSASKVIPSVTKRIVLYGDSIGVGSYSTNPSLQGWIMILRSAYNNAGGSFVDLAYGYRALHDDCTDVSSCQSLANLLTGYFSGITNKYIYLQLSTNDYGLDLWSASSFQTNYARLLNDIHSNDSSIIIYAQTALNRATETANTHGSTMGDYRTAVTTECNARSSYCIVVDGTAILTTAQLQDGVHPTLAAQTVYADYVKALFGL